EIIAYGESGKVRKQDWFRVMASLGMNQHTRHAAWNHLKKNWKALVKKYGAKNISYSLKYIPAYLLSKEDLKDVKKFFKTHRLEGAERTMKQVVETIETNIKWRERALPEIKNWLSKQ
ncbi:MAG: ERAP1-like C-terminal domain-containing protein, partial [Patescibacteria group bacterium]